MKINDVKHNHSLTELLKIFLFSVLMCIPLLSVAVRCAYVVVNKNAYQSAEITQTTYDKIETNVPTNEVNTWDTLILGNYYYFSNVYTSDFDEGQYYKVKMTNNSILSIEDFQSDGLDDLSIDDAITGDTNIELTIYNNHIYYNIWFQNKECYISLLFWFSECQIIGDFQLIDCGYDTSYYIGEILPSNLMITTYDEVESTTLDNVFEYSLNKLEEEEYLTWTQNTAVYQGVKSMTTQLGITQNTLPMLITYWFFLVIIYVILDIVLKLFTTLTHMIGGKKST